MAWILLEGLDRSGKSSVAEYYKKQGYEVVHMSAPNKKHFETGYSGPSYLEEIVDMYNIYAGKNVVFDRTVYGELVWPEVFNRMPLLNDEDLEYLAQLEYNQNVERYLLTDSDAEAHWKRCVDNKEPINRIQFVQAGRLYDKLENERGFERKQLGDFDELAKSKPVSKEETKTSKTKKDTGKSRRDSDSVGVAEGLRPSQDISNNGTNLTMEDRLNRANAIRSLLSGKIIKKKDSIYEDLEKDIRLFLQEQLEGLFTNKSENSFDDDEITILKSMAQRIKDKM